MPPTDILQRAYTFMKIHFDLCFVFDGRICMHYHVNVGYTNIYNVGLELSPISFCQNNLGKITCICNAAMEKIRGWEVHIPMGIIKLQRETSNSRCYNVDNPTVVIPTL